MISRETVDSYFRSRDWRFIKCGDNIWHTGFRGRIRNYKKNFEMFVYVDEDWVYLQVPFLNHSNQECRPALNEFLLHLNFRIFFGKFGLDGERVILSVELPRNSGVEQLNDAVWALDQYTDRFFLEIMTLALDPTIATLWQNRERHVKQPITPEEDEVPDIIFND